MFDWASGDPIAKENGCTEMLTQAVPRKGDCIAYAGRAWMVKEVVFVDDGSVHCMCKSQPNRTFIASLSSK
jgi:hypothetical protein